MSKEVYWHHLSFTTQRINNTNTQNEGICFVCVALDKRTFLNFSTVFLSAVKMKKLRNAHCSPPLVYEGNSMVFTSHLVPFPATRDLRSLVAGNGTS